MVIKVTSTELIERLETEITDGKNWYIALLETICLWTEDEETYNERLYHYLIAGEAFDWLILAERLCDSIGGLIPEDEKDALLYHAQPPVNIPQDEFKKLIGAQKYHQYMNYFYGITVEEALIQAVYEEVRKEKWVAGDTREQDYSIEVFRRIYGTTKAVLLNRFRKEKKLSQRKSINLDELKEFYYWLFKYRLEQCDKSRIASDTKKGLDWLKEQQNAKGLHEAHVIPEPLAN